MNHLSVKIKRLREARNYSQDYLASQLQISQQTYSRIERDVSNLTVQRLQRIADILDYDYVKLLSIPVQRFTSPFAKFSQQNSNAPMSHRLTSIKSKLQTLEDGLSLLRDEVNGTIQIL